MNRALSAVGMALALACVALPALAETPSEEWERGKAWYGAYCSKGEGAPGTPTFNACVRRLLDAAAATRARLNLPAPSSPPPPTREVDPNSLEGQLTREYGERCRLAGYQPGTTQFGRCLLAAWDADKAQEEARRQAQDEARRQALRDFADRLQRNSEQTMRALSNLPRPSYGRMCTSIVNGNIVNTSCY